MIYDGQGTSNTNKVSVYLALIIVVDGSSQSNIRTEVLMCGTAIHTWNGIQTRALDIIVTSPIVTLV